MVANVNTVPAKANDKLIPAASINKPGAMTAWLTLLAGTIGNSDNKLNADQQGQQDNRIFILVSLLCISKCFKVSLLGFGNGKMLLKPFIHTNKGRSLGAIRYPITLAQ
jgi:hypothetical protein